MATWPQTCDANTTAVCGDFETPAVPDLGQCAPYRSKRDCEAPTLPVAPCGDETFYAESNPDAVAPEKQFHIVATLFDEECNPILDELGRRILTNIS